PFAREASRLGLQVGRRVAGQPRRLVGLGIGHLRVQVVVDEEAPHVLVRHLAHELLDVDAAIAERAALAIGFGDLRLDGDDTFEAGLEVVHARISSSSISRPAPRSRAAPSTSAAAATSCTATPTDLYTVSSSGDVLPVRSPATSSPSSACTPAGSSPASSGAPAGGGASAEARDSTTRRASRMVSSS